MFFREKIENCIDYSVDRLVFGTAQLEQEVTLSEAGLVDECTVNALVELEGGKRKRKKKVYTTPKKVGHKHKKRPKALLEYFSVEASGKVKKLKQESPNAPPGTFMAEHADRYVCGRTGHTFFRLGADGKRLPIPKNNKPAGAVAAAAPVKGKAVDAKKKKK